MLSILRALAGIILLTSGRKLYWFFVGAIGFVTGIYLAAMFFKGENEILQIIIALGVGIICVLFAFFIQRIAVAAAGFIAGGYVIQVIAGLFWPQASGVNWIIFLIGGILGIGIASLLLDWALIFLSTLSGSALIVQGFNLNGWLGSIAFFGLVLFGLIIQINSLKSEGSH